MRDCEAKRYMTNSGPEKHRPNNDNQTRGARPNNLTVPCEPTHKTTWRFPLWI